MALRHTELDGRPPHDAGHFAPTLLYAAAKMYYEEDATQAEIAVKLATSRATVSRLLAEARRQGIVRIEVVAPEHGGTADLARKVASVLGSDDGTPVGGAAPGQRVEGGRGRDGPGAGARRRPRPGRGQAGAR